MPDTLPHSVVYSCTFANYDYTLGPLMRTPNTDFLRFGTTSPNRHRIWQHKAVPAALEQNTQTLTNRYFKLFPAKVLPECDIAIYVDGNILVRESLAPIIREFWESDADVAAAHLTNAPEQVAGVIQHHSGVAAFGDQLRQQIG